MPRAGVRKSRHAAYLSDREKYVRACARSPGTMRVIAALVGSDEAAGDLARVPEHLVRTPFEDGGGLVVAQ